MNPFRIVLAVDLEPFIDLSPVALRLRNTTLELASKHSAIVDVVTVENLHGGATGLESNEEKLARFVEPFRASEILVYTHILYGEPSEQIEKLTKSVNAGYLVIATHNTPQLVNGPVGSIAKKLLKESTAPLWIVRPTRCETEKTDDMKIGEYPCLPFLFE